MTEDSLSPALKIPSLSFLPISYALFIKPFVEIASKLHYVVMFVSTGHMFLIYLF